MSKWTYMDEPHPGVVTEEGLKRLRERIQRGLEQAKCGGHDNVIVDTDTLGLHPVPERFIEATLVLTYPTREETAVRALGVKTW